MRARIAPLAALLLAVAPAAGAGPARPGAVPGQEAPPDAAREPGKEPRDAAKEVPKEPPAPKRAEPPPRAEPQRPEPPRFVPDVSRLGPFDVDDAPAQLAQVPELRACAADLARPSGRADCALGPNDLNLARAQLAWEDGRPGGEVLALRLVFDPLRAPPLTELEWQLTRGWGPPVLEQLRRERDLKIFTLQWEDAEHRASLEASGPSNQPSRAVALVLEKRPRPMPAELAGLKPKPFPNLRVRLARRLDWDGQTWAIVWGTSLQPAQEVLGEASPAWAQQRSYVGLWKLEGQQGRRRWRAAWERTGGEEEEDAQRVRRVEVRDVTGDGVADVIVELACQACGQTTSEVTVKTVRAGKLVDLLAKRELLHARVDLATLGQVRISESEGDDALSISTYSYDRAKGAFVLARQERRAGRPE